MTPVSIKKFAAVLAMVAVGAFGGIVVSGCSDDDVDNAQDQVDSAKSELKQTTDDVQDQVDEAQDKADAIEDDADKELENAQDKVDSVKDDTEDDSGGN